MRLEDLSDVHARRHADRTQDDLDGAPVGQERHVLHGQDLGDHALVAVPPGHLVALGDLALLRDAHPHQLVHARWQLGVGVALEDAHVDDLAALAVRDAQRRVFHFTRLFAEDRAQQALFRGEFRLALGRDLPDEDIARLDLRADADDAVLVEVAQRVLAYVRNVARDLLGAQLGISRLDLVLLDVDRGELVLVHERLGDDDRILEVRALPGHEGDQHVLAER